MDIWERAAKALVMQDDSKNGRVQRDAATVVVKALESAPGAHRGEVLSRLILDIQGFSPEPLFELPTESKFAVAIFISTQYFDRSDAVYAARVVAKLNNVKSWEDFLANERALTRFQCIIPVDPRTAISGLQQSGSVLHPVVDVHAADYEPAAA